MNVGGCYAPFIVIHSYICVRPPCEYIRCNLQGGVCGHTVYIHMRYLTAQGGVCAYMIHPSCKTQCEHMPYHTGRGVCVVCDCNPFNTVYEPLNHSSNPGANVSPRQAGRAGGGRVHRRQHALVAGAVSAQRKAVRASTDMTPLPVRYAVYTLCVSYREAPFPVGYAVYIHTDSVSYGEVVYAYICTSGVDMAWPRLPRLCSVTTPSMTANTAIPLSYCLEIYRKGWLYTLLYLHCV
jgi:hypothetical protein